VVNHTIATDPAIQQHGFNVIGDTWCVRLSRLLVSFRMHFKSLHFHFISFHGLCLTVFGQVKARVIQTCTNGVLPNHWHATVASSRPSIILSTRVHWQNLKVDCNYFTKLKKIQSSGWNQQWLQHSRN